MSEQCPICNLDTVIVNKIIYDRQLRLIVDCHRCGSFQITERTIGYLKNELKSEVKNMLLSHAIRKMQKNTAEISPFLSYEQVLQILSNSVPKPNEQINNFILWLGDNSSHLGELLSLDMLVIQTEIGASTLDGLRTIVKYLNKSGIVEGDDPIRRDKIWEMRLTINGWREYEKLRSGSSATRKAFIAMKFGEKELDEMLIKCFKPAVKATGFDLFRLDDVPKAGLIDDRLRVEIRTSRFLIADLTHENAGAYWEAGFAEGLGKPVIYTCEKKKFEENKTHFDTNHHTTVLWDKDDLINTAKNLKNTIRATLPDEAKLVDEDVN